VLAQEYLVIGGQQRNARSLGEREEGWYKFQRGVMLSARPEPLAVLQLLDYVSPPEVCAPDEPAILFKSGTVVGDRLYACTQTEVLVYQLPDLTLVEYASAPCFNDVHHVHPTPHGSLLVAISGLDGVVDVSHSGEVLQEWSTMGGTIWDRFSPDVDYRRIASTKPHQSHPNQVFYIDDEPWVTRFEQRDAVSLRDPKRRIAIDIERVHDGAVVDRHVYFTTVNGHIVVANVDTLVVEDIFDINPLYPDDVLLGWCRGIHVDGDIAWVGFSRLRLTAVRENLSWVRNRFRRHLATRIACINLRTYAVIAEIDVQAHGLDAVFSIHPFPTH